MSILRVLLFTLAITNVWASRPAMAARIDAVVVAASPGASAAGGAVFEKEEEEKEEPPRPISEDEI